MSYKSENDSRTAGGVYQKEFTENIGKRGNDDNFTAPIMHSSDKTAITILMAFFIFAPP